MVLKTLPTLSKQAGLGSMAWLMMIGLALVIGITALKIVPVYLENHSIKSIMEEVAADPVSRNRSAKEIRTIIIKRMKINNIYKFDPKNIKIEPDRSGKRIVIEYEVRDSLYGNIDFVAMFRNEAAL